ncbi:MULTISPECIES: DUF2999 family protein [unclassified Pseudoalteromonas]|uniref:DUF2999 family protein n=1 Tax=unclassified Pseudoalteromonas TaxID=194690 RepID=UPI001023CF54|nr:DUF2999 domain-containing protein [Pseudoalteromonas sp. L1]RZF94187.1 DUF2999 family protein [Pseudoalteromonas sp. CO302Y]RZG10572.1 DUF2999 family protein [Pseudoalteromonas sp. CO133X]WOC27660.1 DUF2999 domain-containing protein [Pseudoalteromonas sp. N1230-9]
MNPIIETLKEHNVSDEQVHALFSAFLENPMLAMAQIQQLGIPPEKLQQLMALVMTQPNLIKDAAESLGINAEQVEQAKQQFKNQ